LSFHIRETHAESPGSQSPLLELISQLGKIEEGDTVERAVAAARQSLGAEVAAVVRAGDVVAVSGVVAPADHALLIDAAERDLHHTTLTGLGALDLLAAPLPDESFGWLLVGRSAGLGYDAEAGVLLDAYARTLGLHLRMTRAMLYDQLTGLANRTLVRDRATRAIEHAPQDADLVAVLFVDIDHFKLTNDALDHRHGDRLLVLVAQRLSTILMLEDNGRRRCTVSRPGGDEFIVLCEGLSDEREGMTIAQQIQDALRSPFFIDGDEVVLTASIGIAYTRAGTAHAQDADTLFRDADVALSRAKDAGRDRYEIFDEPMRASLLERIKLESDLRVGLEREELRLLFQPVVTVSDGSLVAVEALVRWQHPSRGLLGPAEFIPVAEQSDLIVELGSWVINEACAQIECWRRAHPAGLGVPVSVNVSARQLSPALIETVAEALERHQVPPAQLALEITETLLIEHTESARDVLAGLEALGILIVLDDFGTGYSSLGYLNEFPLGQLKLDRSFTADLARDARSAKIVAATVDMARALGMTVVAEGVETEDQVEVLRRLGCDYAQGFLFAAPEPPEAIFERTRAAFERDQQIGTEAAEPVRPGIQALSTTAPTSIERRKQVAIGRLAGWLFLVGSVVAMPSDFVVGTIGLETVLPLTAMGVLTGLICLRVRWDRVSGRWLHVAAVVGTLEISCSVFAIGRNGEVLAPIYLLIATVAAYAFSRRAIAAHLALISAAMTIPVFDHHASHHTVALMLVSIGVLAIITVLITYLRELLEGGAAELRELAARDPLTDIGNYRLLHERLEYELTRHRRNGRQLAVLLLDLDRFKQVNDRRGHAAGDDVLRRVAGTLREAVRQQDTVARQGGDEFAVLAPDTDAEGAAMLATRIRDRLIRVQFAGDSIGATVGWAVFPADGETVAELLARADEQLRNGKLEPAARTLEPRPPRTQTTLLEGS
jgi:diguanylate cyclase (GGDEF)-like protein